jgi:hypothetical protein
MSPVAANDNIRGTVLLRFPDLKVCKGASVLSRPPSAPGKGKRITSARLSVPTFEVRGRGASHPRTGRTRTTRTVRLQIEGVSGRLLSQGGTSKADAEAGVDAWRSLLEFLEAGVKGRRYSSSLSGFVAQEDV